MGINDRERLVNVMIIEIHQIVNTVKLLEASDTNTGMDRQTRSLLMVVGFGLFFNNSIKSSPIVCVLEGVVTMLSSDITNVSNSR